MSKQDSALIPERETVSIIVPTYNAGRYLDQALRSAEAQTHRRIEIICVNDGSTDDSPAIMRAHAEQDGRIRIIDQENRGYGAAMNAGIDAATGTWIAILEPDDWIEPGMLADMLAIAARYETANLPIDIVETPYWVIHDPDTPRELKLPCNYKGRVQTKPQPFTVHDAPHLLGHHPSIWSAIYRTRFLREHDIRFREIPGAGWADNPFLVETLCQARAICYLDRAYYCYREETPEKEVALAHRSPLLPFDRWEDMADVLDRLHVTDPVVWTQQITRGFTYLGGIVQNTGLEDKPQIKAAVERMFSRMDPSLVFANPRVSPAAKRLFARYRGIEHPPISEWMHIKDLLGEGIYFLTSKGPGQTAEMIHRYFRDYRSRAGGKR